jgi:hypothetical protein
VTAHWQDPTPAQAGADFGNVERIHPVMLAVLAALLLLMMALPRARSTWPVVLLLCFVPSGQRFLVATLDFPFLRLLMVAAWARLIVRGEVRALAWNRLDRLLIAWAVVAVLTGTLHTSTWQQFLNRASAAFDALAIYFFFRQFLRTAADVAVVARQFLVCSFAVLGFMAIEYLTTRNVFGTFGGVPEITDVRDGRLRCQGAFAHPILAGCFYACLLPLYALLGFVERRWHGPVAGAAAAVAIAVLTASSTPVVAVLMAVACAMAWPLRSALPHARWLALLGLLCLHFLMKQPVWHLLARVDVAGGSTGWHRFHLVDQFFARLDEWWLLGTARTGHWGIGLHDVTNQYVAEGVGGGLARLCVFLLVILTAFQGVSRTLRLQQLPRRSHWIAWALGTALFVHCVNFVAVTYFEQIIALWLLTLAAIGSTTLVPGTEPERRLAVAAMPAGT